MKKKGERIAEVIGEPDGKPAAKTELHKKKKFALMKKLKGKDKMEVQIDGIEIEWENSPKCKLRRNGFDVSYFD